jgi:hypothetical protein
VQVASFDRHSSAASGSAVTLTVTASERGAQGLTCGRTQGRSRCQTSYPGAHSVWTCDTKAERWAPGGLGSTVHATCPGPVPADGENRIQGWSDAMDHSHCGLPRTSSVPLPPRYPGTSKSRPQAQVSSAAGRSSTTPKGP